MRSRLGSTDRVPRLRDSPSNTNIWPTARRASYTTKHSPSPINTKRSTAASFISFVTRICWGSSSWDQCSTSYASRISLRKRSRGNITPRLSTTRPSRCLSVHYCAFYRTNFASNPESPSKTTPFLTTLDDQPSTQLFSVQSCWYGSTKIRPFCQYP